jgi:hypothetical protein
MSIKRWTMPKGPRGATGEIDARFEALRAEIAGGRASGPGVAAEKVFARSRTRIDATAGEAAGD